MQAKGLPNKEAENAWKIMVECSIRALWISRCKNKLGGEPYNIVLVTEVFLTLLACLLKTVWMKYRMERRNLEDFIRDWGENGRLAQISADGKRLLIQWPGRR